MSQTNNKELQLYNFEQELIEELEKLEIGSNTKQAVLELACFAFEKGLMPEPEEVKKPSFKVEGLLG